MISIDSCKMKTFEDVFQVSLNDVNADLWIRNVSDQNFKSLTGH